MLYAIKQTDFKISDDSLFNILIVLITLVLSIVLIWSTTTQFGIPSRLNSTLVGYFFDCEVIGQTTIVAKYLFISLGQIITQGRVFFISWPTIGSKLTITISY